MRSIRFTCVDVIAVTLVTSSLATLVTAAGLTGKEIAGRATCQRQLQQIGEAIAKYANENRGAYPRTTYAIGTPLVWGTPYADDGSDAKPHEHADPFAMKKTAPPEVVALKPKPNDVTAPLYLLLRTQDLGASNFTCPSSGLKPYAYPGEGAGAHSFTNFAGKNALAKHLSYSYQNPYPTAEAVAAGFKLNNSITAEFAVMADMNPGGNAVTSVKLTSPAAEVRPANSLNHKGDGQNVLFGDGHVDFVQTPFVGVLRDNIYVANDSNERTKRKGASAILASSSDADDTILLPTAADLGQVIEHVEHPITKVADLAAIARKVAGTYEANSPAGPAVVVIDDTTIRITHGDQQAESLSYRVLGTRGDATVVEVTSPRFREAIESEFVVTADGVTFDGIALRRR